MPDLPRVYNISKKEVLYGKRKGHGQSSARKERAVDYACWHQGQAVRRLDKYLAQGLITQDEHAVQRARILAEL